MVLDQQIAASGSVIEEKKKLAAFLEAWPPAVLIAIFWLALVILIAVIAPSIVPYDFMILLESSLSFFGIGLQPPQTSLGNMVGYGRDYIQSAPWIMLMPAAVIVITTLSVSVVGDWLRDRLDPTLR